jgi:hypothetical protein
MGEDLIFDEAEACLLLIMASSCQPYIKDRPLFQSKEKSPGLSKNDSRPIKESGRIFGKSGGKLKETHRKEIINADQNFRIF